MAKPLSLRALRRRQPGHLGRDFHLGPLTFDLQAGEILGLAGPNGSGKSTLLLILAGLLRADQGEFTYDGAPVRLTDPSWRGRVGLLRAKESAFYPNLSAFENLLFFAALAGQGGRAARRSVAEKLERVGLDERADEPVRVYSSGMAARLALARTFMREPEILLLDEPTRSLDSASAEAFIRYLRQGLEGQSILWVSHHSAELERAASRVLHIADGLLVAPPEAGGFLILAAAPGGAAGETLAGAGGLVWDEDLGALRLPTGNPLPPALAALEKAGAELHGVERLHDGGTVKSGMRRTGKGSP